MDQQTDRLKHDSHGKWHDAAFIIALLATALALGGALAHAYELLNKIDMPRDDYFVVQRAYDGWNKLAYVIAVQLIGILGVITVYRETPAVLYPALAALGALLASQAVFWAWTFPANQATENWTTQPDNWKALRAEWEYSHLVGAFFQLIVMTALVVAVLRRSRQRQPLL